MAEDIVRKKFNVSLLGESDVGKTSMTNCYLEKTTNGEYGLSTIGIESFIDMAKFENVEYKFKIYDTAGQERYRSLSKSTIKITDGILLVFSVANKSSFDRISYWYNSIKDEVDVTKKIIFLVGNKIDLENREVSKEEAESYAKSKKMKYYETSATKGLGIKEVFKQLYQDVYDFYKTKKESNNFELGRGKKKKSRC